MGMRVSLCSDDWELNSDVDLLNVIELYTLNRDNGIFYVICILSQFRYDEEQSKK